MGAFSRPEWRDVVSPPLRPGRQGCLAKNWKVKGRVVNIEVARGPLHPLDGIHLAEGLEFHVLRLKGVEGVCVDVKTVDRPQEELRPVPLVPRHTKYAAREFEDLVVEPATEVQATDGDATLVLLLVYRE